MIIDCIPFFNELDLLEVRLNELANIVDVFVISEATLTFSGKEKPLYFNKNKNRFKQFNIEHVIIDKYKKIDINNPWSMDRGQKQIGINKMVERLKPSNNDIVIVSDCDEIPRANTITKALKESWTIASLKMPIFYYWINCQCVNKIWRRAKLVRWQDKPLRHKKIRYGRSDIAFKNGGWHFGYLENIKNKIDAFAHQEYNKPPYNIESNIKLNKEKCTDLYNRDYVFTINKNLSYLPQYILHNERRFNKWIHQC